MKWQFKQPTIQSDKKKKQNASWKIALNIAVNFGHFKTACP